MHYVAKAFLKSETRVKLFLASPMQCHNIFSECMKTGWIFSYSCWQCEPRKNVHFQMKNLLKYRNEKINQYSKLQPGQLKLNVLSYFLTRPAIISVQIRPQTYLATYFVVERRKKNKKKLFHTCPIVSSSGSSWGSAQSTIISQLQTLIRPVSNRRLARLAALWDSYSRKQNPLKNKTKRTIVKLSQHQYTIFINILKVS